MKVKEKAKKKLLKNKKRKKKKVPNFFLEKHNPNMKRTVKMCGIQICSCLMLGQ